MTISERWAGSPAATSGRRSAHLALIVLVAANIILGLGLAPDFGQSTDETANVRYGERSVRSYLDPLHPYRDPTREDKGPFYLMLWASIAPLFERAIPQWDAVDARHFVNFLSWQIAVLSVYSLSRRMASPPAALLTTLLFQTQPLLFGHAFINQKDSPFMAFFAASVAVGMNMVDRLGPTPGTGRGAHGILRFPRFVWQDLVESWRAMDRPSKRRVTALAVASASILLARWLADSALRPWISSRVREAYTGEAWRPIQWAFSWVAQNAANQPMDPYVARALLVVDVATVLVSLLLFAAALVSAATFRRSVDERWRIRESVRAVWPAAVILGMAIAIRSVAVFAGLLVIGYAVVRAGRTGIGKALILLGLASLVAFASWPQLWGSPAAFFQSSAVRTLGFPEEHEVLFRGVIYSSHSLPLDYLPWLMIIQFTLPAWALIVVGGLRSAALSRRDPRAAATFGLMSVWYLLPFAAVVALGVPIYNNFRHLLFITPALFVVAATGWDWLLGRVETLAGRILLSVLLLAPGAAAIVRLHPYEYVYFNELVGGVQGAYGEYLLDSWCTAYREAAQAVNRMAREGAVVIVWGPRTTAEPFLRQDLRLASVPVPGHEADLGASLAMGCSWATIDPKFFPGEPIVWAIERDGVPLAIVKRIRSEAGDH